MKKNLKVLNLFTMSYMLLVMYIPPSYAGYTFGDPKTEQGAVTLSGYIRGNFQEKDYSYAAKDGKIQFDAVQLKLDYDAKNVFGHFEYRCYQYDRLCDFSTLVDAYVGYKILNKNSLTVGIQPIPFGPTRFWESSLYGGINNTVGLEDAHNIGANLHWEFLSSQTQIDAGYFIHDAGNFFGDSKDAARYTANLVSSDDMAYSNLNEKNMWIARITQDIFPLMNNHLNMKAGASYWYSEIESKSNHQDGNRNAWSIFGILTYDDFTLNLTGGKTEMKTSDSLSTSASKFGSYDSEYLVANDATFYTADVSYQFKDLIEGVNLRPYFMHSSYLKEPSQFKNSQRNIIGLGIDYKNISLISEYILSKNDPFIGGGLNSLAEGDLDQHTNKLLNFTLFYHF